MNKHNKINVCVFMFILIHLHYLEGLCIQLLFLLTFKNIVIETCKLLFKEVK